MNPLTSFEELTDPRKPHLIKYELKSLIFTTISAVLSGFETYTEIALFALEKRDWITRFVPFPQGHFPSHDIFGDLFSSLCPKEFGRCFGAFDSITPYSTNQTINKEHGRIETRTCTVVNQLGLIDDNFKMETTQLYHKS